MKCWGGGGGGKGGNLVMDWHPIQGGGVGVNSNNPGHFMLRKPG